MRFFLFIFFMIQNILNAQFDEKTFFFPDFKLEKEIVLEKRPLFEMLAERDRSSLKLEINGKVFYVTYVFDTRWEPWFSIKPQGSFKAQAWSEKRLESGVFYEYEDVKLVIRKIDNIISIQFSPYDTIELERNKIFSALYENSYKITFGELVTYAVFRNLSPLSEEEGTVTIRLGLDGFYYYSLTSDKKIENSPRWLLAINGTLYGIEIKENELVFVSKQIQIKDATFFDEVKFF